MRENLIKFIIAVVAYSFIFGNYSMQIIVDLSNMQNFRSIDVNNISSIKIKVHIKLKKKKHNINMLISKNENDNFCF